MARRASSRQGAARTAAHAARSPGAKSPTSSAHTRGSSATTRRSSRLSSIVSSLKSRALLAARRAAGRRVSKSSMRPASAAEASTHPAAASSTKAALPPIKRVSVVRKPARGPSARSTRTAQPAVASAPIKRRSIVRKPARGPSIRTMRMTASPRRHASDTSASSPQPGAEASKPTAQLPAFTEVPPTQQPVAQPGGSIQTWASTQASTGEISVEQRFTIPTSYGDDRIVLMVKDPWWLYAYWEIQPRTERAVRGQLLPHEVSGLQSILRVSDVSGREFPEQPAHRSFDVGLSGLATNWYLQTNEPGREFIVEIGLLANTGRFLLLARSNRVRTPRFGPSEAIDEAWMTTDEAYWKLFGVSAGVGIGSSPTAWTKLIPQQFFSGNWSSGGLYNPVRPSIVQGFWCRVNTDLVIHGATEPKSAVVIQGQRVMVRKDGTFSLRLTLPEGTQTIAIDVTAPDGQHTKTVTPIVTLAWAGVLAPDVTTVRARRSQSTSRDGSGAPAG